MATVTLAVFLQENFRHLLTRQPVVLSAEIFLSKSQDKLLLLKEAFFCFFVYVKKDS